MRYGKSEVDFYVSPWQQNDLIWKLVAQGWTTVEAHAAADDPANWSDDAEGKKVAREDIDREKYAGARWHHGVEIIGPFRDQVPAGMTMLICEACRDAGLPEERWYALVAAESGGKEEFRARHLPWGPPRGQEGLEEHILTPAEAAEISGMSESHWRNSAAAGKVPGAFMKGKQWLIPRDTVRPRPK